MRQGDATGSFAARRVNSSGQTSLRVPMGTAADSRTTVPGPHPPITLFLLLRCFLLGFFLGHDELLWVVVKRKQGRLSPCSTARGAGVTAANHRCQGFGTGGNGGTETQFGDYHRPRDTAMIIVSRALVVIGCRTSQSIQNLRLPRLVVAFIAPSTALCARWLASVSEVQPIFSISPLRVKTLMEPKSNCKCFLHFKCDRSRASRCDDVCGV